MTFCNKTNANSYGNWQVGLLTSLPSTDISGESFMNIAKNSQYGYTEKYYKKFYDNEKVTITTSGYAGIWLTQQQQSVHALVHVVYN